MSSSPKNNYSITEVLKKCQNSDDILDIENINIDQDYDALFNYLQQLNQILKDNLKNQEHKKTLKEILQKESDFLEKKVKINEQQIDEKNKQINKLETSSVNNVKKRSFFESLQASNDQEVAEKKKNSLISDIKEIEDTVSKCTDTKNSLSIKSFNFDNKNKNLENIISKILKKISELNIESISENNLKILKESSDLINKNYLSEDEQLQISRWNSYFLKGLFLILLSFLLVKKF